MPESNTTRLQHTHDSLRASALAPFSYFSAIVMVAFGVVSIVELGHTSGILAICLGGATLLNRFYYKKSRQLLASASLYVFLVALALVYIFYSNAIPVTGVFWLSIFPVPTVLLLGRKYGVVAVVAYAALFVPALVVSNAMPLDSSVRQVWFLFTSLAVTTTIVVLYERLIGQYFTVAEQHAKQLQAGTNELSLQINQREALEAKMREVLSKYEENNHKLEELTQIDEATISSIGEAVLMLNQKGVTTKANVSTGRILGINQADLVGQKITKILNFYEVEGDAKVEEEDVVIMRAITHRSIVEETYKIIRPDKSFLYAQITASPLVVNGVVFGVVVAIRDVTQEINIDQAKTEFVSIASHQLRTPLSTINWYLEMILAGDFGEITSDQREFIQEAYDASQRMGGLIDALLNVSRIDVGVFAIDPQPVDIQKLIDDVMIDLSSKIKEKNLKITTKVNSAIGTPKLDPRLMNIIFLNLISNAVKYTPSEGTVTTRVDLRGGMITIKVTDTGYGIPEHQQDQIFSKLFRAQNAVENEPDGTGLGLYIVKAIVDEVKGSISFESKEGRGTTFFIEIPRDGMPQRKGARELTPGAGV